MGTFFNASSYLAVNRDVADAAAKSGMSAEEFAQQHFQK
jgi:hypothetical protein